MSMSKEEFKAKFLSDQKARKKQKILDLIGFGVSKKYRIIKACKNFIKGHK